MKETGLLVKLFRRELKLSEVSPDETIAIVTDVKSREEFVGATFAAAADIGAEVFEIQLPEYGKRRVGDEYKNWAGGVLPLPEQVTETLCGVDFVLDLTLEGFIHVPERKPLREAGTRIVRASAQEPYSMRQAMAWTEEEAAEYKAKAQDAAERMAASDEMRVTTPHGTDATMQIEPDTIFPSYGYSDEPGHWDVVGQNMVLNYPSNVNGTIVMTSRDYNVGPYNDFYSSKVTVQIENSYITAIEGDGRDAELMRDHMASFDDEDAYYTSHFGWGFNDDAKLYNKAIYDRRPNKVGVSADEGRVWNGNVLWSTGPDWRKDRYTNCHYDITLQDCTVTLDDEIVVDSGEVVHLSHE